MKQGILVRVATNRRLLVREVVNIEDETSIENEIKRLLSVDAYDVFFYKDTSIYVDKDRFSRHDYRDTLILTDIDVSLKGDVLVMGDIDYEGNVMDLSIDNVESFNNAISFLNSRFEEMIRW